MEKQRSPAGLCSTLIMMCGYLGTGAMIGAKVRTHTPVNKSGMFQGLRDAETIVGDDGTFSFIPNENIFLAALVVGVFIWLVLIPLFREPKKETNYAA